MTEILDHGAGHYFTTQFFHARPIDNAYGPTQNIPSTGSPQPPTFVQRHSPGLTPFKPSNLVPGKKTEYAEAISAIIGLLAIAAGLYVMYQPGPSISGYPKSYIYALLAVVAAMAGTLFGLLYTGKISA